MAATIAFDFDGVLHEHPRYHWPAGRLDLEPLNEAIRRGYHVAVMTCNVPKMVGDLLEARGLKVYVDKEMKYGRWDQKGIVLVTNRKVSAVAYVDDRAIRWTIGSNPRAIWDAAETARPSTPHPRSWRQVCKRIKAGKRNGVY